MIGAAGGVRGPVRHRNVFRVLDDRISPYEDDWSPLLPTQIRESGRLKPEHMLLLAVVADALKAATAQISCNCHERYCCHNAPRRNARDWLFDTSDCPYSYEWCCEHLQVNPAIARRQVKRYDLRRSGLPLFSYATGSLGETRSRKTA